MADGLHQVMTELQKLTVLLIACLQFVDKFFAFFLFAMITPDFPVDGDMGQAQKEDGGGQGKDEQERRAVLRFQNLVFPL